VAKQKAAAATKKAKEAKAVAGSNEEAAGARGAGKRQAAVDRDEGRKAKAVRIAEAERAPGVAEAAGATPKTKKALSAPKAVQLPREPRRAMEDDEGEWAGEGEGVIVVHRRVPVPDCVVVRQKRVPVMPAAQTKGKHRAVADVEGGAPKRQRGQEPREPTIADRYKLRGEPSQKVSAAFPLPVSSH
ncbi:hypothetical protein C0991_010271, partial [Blastosporella zonata]